MDTGIKKYNSLRDLQGYKDALNKQIETDEKEIKHQHNVFKAQYR